MKRRAMGFGAMAVAALLTPESASACHKCHRTPCVLAPPPAVCAPAVQCVTEMVPYTVMQPRMRMDFREETVTVMERVPETTFVERQRVVCKPVVETTYIPRTVTVCKPVFQTDYVTQNVTVCRPETTTQQVTEYCMQPTTQYVTVPVGGKCGRCGHAKPACTCTVAQTCYTPVPVVRDVTVTRMVPEVQTRQVPVTRCSIVPEQKTVEVPVINCRIVQEVVTERIPIVNVRCVPRTITRQIPVPVCETVAVTCYRPVTRMVPVVPVAAPAPAMAAPQAAPSGQASPQTGA